MCIRCAQTYILRIWGYFSFFVWYVNNIYGALRNLKKNTQKSLSQRRWEDPINPSQIALSIEEILSVIIGSEEGRIKRDWIAWKNIKKDIPNERPHKDENKTTTAVDWERWNVMLLIHVLNESLTINQKNVLYCFPIIKVTSIAFYLGLLHVTKFYTSLL